MASNKGQNSCVATLWIFFLVVGIVPGVVSNVELTRNPSTTQPICPGETIEFTCTTTGSSRLLWTSDEYIGANSQFEFRSIDVIGTTRNTTANADTIANLTDNIISNRILTSTLYVVTSQSSTIACINGDDRMRATSSVLIAAVPGAPQNLMAVGSVDDCMIQVNWDSPGDAGGSDYMYRIDIPSRNIAANTSSSIKSTLHVPNCADDIIPIQVSAVSSDGCYSIQSSEILLHLQSGSNTNGLSVPVVGGIVVGIFAFFVICCVFVALVIFYFTWKASEWKRKSEQKRKNEQKRDSDKKDFISNLLNLYSILKWNQTSSIQEAAIKLLGLTEEMPSTDVKEALKTVLETKFTSAKEIWNALVQLKLTISAVIQTFDDKLQEPLDELKKQVDKASPEDVKDHLWELFEALKGDSSKDSDHVHPHRAQDGRTVPCTT